MTGPNGPAEAVTEQLRLALPEEFSLDLPARGPVRFVVERDRRRRTRVGIVIDPAGFVRMDAPTNAELEEIREIAREHARWISRRLSQLGELGTYYVSPGFETGELHHYLGAYYSLVLVRHHGEPVIELTDKSLVVTMADHEADAVKRAINNWYGSRADELLARRLEHFVPLLPFLGDEVPTWRHLYMRSQWGSCSSTRKISLNTHLMKTPVELIDYVVLHELCHLKHLNHGRRFYSLMDRHMPDWQVKREALNRWMGVLSD